MPHYLSARAISVTLIGLIGFGLSSCAVYDRPYGPGYVHTMPAAGITYYDYWYYPSVQVYYDINRHVYFYLSSSGWVQVRVLPPALKIRLGVHVPLHSHYAKPYREYNEHRRKYPPQYRVTPPPARHGGSSSPYPHNYQPPPVKKAPEQYQHERRYEQQYQQQEYNRERPRYQQVPLKKAPADNKRRSQTKDKQSNKSSKDTKQKNNKDKQSDRGRDKKQRDDQDRDRQDYR